MCIGSASARSVLYSVESARVTVIVLKVGQRKDVYR